MATKLKRMKPTRYIDPLTGRKAWKFTEVNVIEKKIVQTKTVKKDNTVMNSGERQEDTVEVEVKEEDDVKSIIADVADVFKGNKNRNRKN